MIAAIYARKSTEQNGVNDEEKSVTRQIEHAKAYATKKGWVVAEEHIYTDDGISGAEFKKRPAFMRMLTALTPTPPFRVLIMSEESRLGREAIETAFVLKQIITAGVQVWFYLEDRQRTLESPTDKLLLSVTAFADELEREKARQRTYDAMARKAKAGHVTGGSVFGYDNIEVPADTPGPDGRVKRSHVVRQINDAEAAVVRRIFADCAAGKGFKRIACQLNEERLPHPRPRASRLPGWAPSAVREILHRELYRGVIVWNKTKKRNPWGVRQQRPRPVPEQVRVPAPHLQIVSDALWQAAHERLDLARQTYLRGNGGKLWGRPASGIAGKYLLTGMAVCGCCGGSLEVRSHDHGRQRVFYYACSTYRRRGKAICANAKEVPMVRADEAVLATIEQEVLRPEVVERAVARALELLKSQTGTSAGQREQVLADLAQAEKELTNLTAAIAATGPLPALLEQAKEREHRRVSLTERLAALEAAAQAGTIDSGALQAELREPLKEWRTLLRRHVAQGRQILRKLLTGRVTFTPRTDDHGTVFEFSAQGTLGRVLEGLSPKPGCPKSAQGVTSPWGFEPALPPGGNPHCAPTDQLQTTTKNQ